MAGMRGLTILAFFTVLACIAVSPALAQSTQGPDGRPRPTGYPDTPTKSYGPTPPCYLNSAPVTCEWYGFAHILYPTTGAQCLTETRRLLSNTTAVPPGRLLPYNYYYLSTFVFDRSTNTSYCLYGCFDMSASSPGASPPAGFAPPPATDATPPATADTPPPVTVSTPPPAPEMYPPPALLTPPTPSAMPPPDAPLTPPAAVPPTSATPPPPGPRVINLNGAGFLQPSGLVSFFISGALLVLNGLVAV